MRALEARGLTDVRARFGAALREWRTRQHLTQEQLAERSGLSYKFIGEVERGVGNPTLVTMAQLAEALGVPLMSLVGAVDSGQSSQDYRVSKRDLQVVREAVASIGALVDQITSPPYRGTKRRRKG
jgi:transcriptional regulator with XRE-family HTH domain